MNKGIKNMKTTQKNKSKKIKNIIEYTIIFLVIFVNGYLITQSFFFPNKTPSIFGKKAFVIVSGSMIPEIQIGDLVIINDTTDVTLNDIIALGKIQQLLFIELLKKCKLMENYFIKQKVITII